MKTNDFRSISTVPDSNMTKRKFKSSIGEKDTFKLESDSTNDFMNKWVYFDLDKPTKLKVILHMTAGVATCSLFFKNIKDKYKGYNF